MITIEFDGTRLMVGYLREGFHNVYLLGTTVDEKATGRSQQDPNREKKYTLHFQVDTSFGRDTVHEGRIAWQPWFNYDNVNARSVVEQKAIMKKYLCRVLAYLRNKDPLCEARLEMMVKDETNGAHAGPIFEAARRCKLALRERPEQASVADRRLPEPITHSATTPASAFRSSASTVPLRPSTYTTSFGTVQSRETSAPRATTVFRDLTSGVSSYLEQPVNIQGEMEGTFKSVTHTTARTLKRGRVIEQDVDTTELLYQDGAISAAKKRCTVQPLTINGCPFLEIDSDDSDEDTA